MARDLARMPYHARDRATRQAYGEGVDGPLARRELLLHLFQERFNGEGSVPAGRAGSAALAQPPADPAGDAQSHGRDQGGQFVIATHSPILLAYPGATILSFDGGKIEPVA